MQAEPNEKRELERRLQEIVWDARRILEEPWRSAFGNAYAKAPQFVDNYMAQYRSTLTQKLNRSALNDLFEIHWNVALEESLVKKAETGKVGPWQLVYYPPTVGLKGLYPLTSKQCRHCELYNRARRRRETGQFTRSKIEQLLSSQPRTRTADQRVEENLDQVEVQISPVWLKPLQIANLFRGNDSVTHEAIRQAHSRYKRRLKKKLLDPQLLELDLRADAMCYEALDFLRSLRRGHFETLDLLQDRWVEFYIMGRLFQRSLRGIVVGAHPGVTGAIEPSL